MPSRLHVLKFQNNTEREGETGHTRKLRLRDVKELPSATKLVSAGDRNHIRPALPTAESLM